ncbi:MAG: hypothetical protein A2Y17_10240 [Clostridiales bacterium GWF2_38_85]|nr:MAG: hypothetical protein A2Y17_10240 [Clostridiales bacterium GWF2_38_85]HBL83294.1 hypothetical protein [Clostridiales bacterium]
MKIKEFWQRCMSVFKNNSGEGSFEIVDGILCFVMGKSRIRIKECFSETDKTVTDLVENTIRYESRIARNELSEKVCRSIDLTK